MHNLEINNHEATINSDVVEPAWAVVTSYEGSNLANQCCRMLDAFERKLEGSHSIFYSYFDKY